MLNRWIEPQACRSLVVLVETVTAPLLIQHESPVCLELDIPASMSLPADVNQTAELLRTLVAQALAEMPDGGDLVVTACETDRGVELELADSGSDAEHRPQSRPISAASIGAELKWQNCPQGGAAVTIVFANKGESGRMAA